MRMFFQKARKKVNSQHILIKNITVTPARLVILSVAKYLILHKFQILHFRSDVLLRACPEK